MRIPRVDTHVFFTVVAVPVWAASAREVQRVVKSRYVPNPARLLAAGDRVADAPGRVVGCARLRLAGVPGRVVGCARLRLAGVPGYRSAALGAR